ncbi:fibrocystin-L-like [Pecten maximus]|uniref:fibrocystin-L-like n=1 Tax=Pecten maximus TaxID=6579 RepID=UPI001458EC5B|nr:fibrocystin-L-like [Pecten maximus]
MADDTYGGQVYVGTAQVNNALYQDYAGLSNVEFYHTGRTHFNRVTNKQFSLLYRNAARVTQNTSSSVTKCSFHNTFSPAIGVIGTSDLALKNNVFHKSTIQAIETQSINTTVRGNLVVLVHGSRPSIGTIHGMSARKLIVEDNHVAGTDGTAFRIPGIECGATSDSDGNEAHTSGLGAAVYPVDNLLQSSCYQLSNFFVWKCGIGIYYNNRLSVVLRKNVVAENTLGLYNQIVGPSSVDHLFAPKYCNITDSLVIGATSSFNCAYDGNVSSNSFTRYNKGHVGMDFTSFMQGSNRAPWNSLVGIQTYPAIMGVTNIHNVTFAHFKTVCGVRDFMLTTNKANDDGQHPVVTSRINVYQSENSSYFLIHRPNIEKVNLNDCVDMDCDGLKKALIKDDDGSFLGTKGAVISKSEWQWNGDTRRGLGDYRIPREMLTIVSGERINVSTIAPHKGIIRNDKCQYRSTWQAYECHDLDYHMMIIESLDADTETRRLSPVAILGDGYLDLINGPQDHSSCTQPTCHKRLSTFMSIVATGKQYVVYFSSTSPKTLRLFLLNANEHEAVTVGVWYSQSNRRDVYMDDDLVQAKNSRMVNGKYIVDPPSYAGEYIPIANSTDQTGSNFFDRDTNILYVLVKGSSPVKIVTNPSFIVSFQIPALTTKEFYGKTLIHNLALFFDVPPEKIRVVNVVREAGRRKRDTSEDMTIQVEIGDPPTAAANATVNETMTTDALMNMSAKFINEVQGGGDISETLNITVKSIGINEPIPELEEEMPEDLNDTPKHSKGILRVPETMKLIVEPVPTHETALLSTQPCLRFFDEENKPLEKLGSISDPWKVTASLSTSSSQPTACLYGKTTTAIIGGWANFTDLRILQFGTNFSIDFTKTYPVSKKPMRAKSSLFSVGKLTLRTGINISTEAYFIPNETVVHVYLIDDETGERITNIGWRGHAWRASITVSNETDATVNMTGSNEALFDNATGEAVFNSLAFDQLGICYLTVYVTSSPLEYAIYGKVKVQLLDEHQADLLNDNTTVITNMTMVFNANYNEVVGNNSDRFGDMVVDYLIKKYPDVLIDTVTVSEGSIKFSCCVHGDRNATNSTLSTIIEDIASGLNFTFNGFTIKVSEDIYANGILLIPQTLAILRQTTLPTENEQTTQTTEIQTTDNEQSTLTTDDTHTTTNSGYVTDGGQFTHTTEPSVHTTTKQQNSSVSPSSEGLSNTYLIVIVVAPMVFLLGIIFLIIYFKSKRQHNPKQRDFLMKNLTGEFDNNRKDTTKENEHSFISHSISEKKSDQFFIMYQMDNSAFTSSIPRASVLGSMVSNKTAGSTIQGCYKSSSSELDLSSLSYYTGNGNWKSLSEAN